MSDHDPLCPIAEYKCLCDRIAISRAGARAEYARCSVGPINDLMVQCRCKRYRPDKELP